MSDVEVKRIVRARDGQKCQDCGMTAEEHHAKHGAKLDVHRLIPGEEYVAERCVTLCRECHDSKPSKIQHLIYGTQDSKDKYGVDEFQSIGLMAFFFNYYDERERDLLKQIYVLCAHEEVSLGEMLNDVISQGLKAKTPTHPVKVAPRMEFDLSSVC